MNLFAFFRNRLERQYDDVLMDHADALRAGYVDRDALLVHYDPQDRDEVEPLMDLAEQVHQLLIPVSPSEQFVAQLHHQLLHDLDGESRTLLERIRYLPPGLQIAAGIGGATLTAGLVLIASRSMPDALEFWRKRTATA